MSGILYGVGVGPGDPKNLTIKAIEIINECDMLAVPGKDADKAVSYSIVKKALPELNKCCICLDMPMTSDEKLLKEAHQNAAERIIEELDRDRNVAFITLGDPTVYSTFTYLRRLVNERGYETKTISGITSFCASAAVLNTALTIENEQLHIIPGAADISELSELEGTIVIMKPSINYGAITSWLKDKGKDAIMIENTGMDNERSYGSVKEFPDKTGYFSIIIIKNGMKHD